MEYGVLNLIDVSISPNKRTKETVLFPGCRTSRRNFHEGKQVVEGQPRCPNDHIFFFSRGNEKEYKKSWAFIKGAGVWLRKKGWNGQRDLVVLIGLISRRKRGEGNKSALGLISFLIPLPRKEGRPGDYFLSARQGRDPPSPLPQYIFPICSPVMDGDGWKRSNVEDLKGTIDQFLPIGKFHSHAQ
ncbi:hypothetical protein JTE90_002646 [Oedothorax gibbosus]|uniref:Uncharacterized protein n=1 Tax=Oedothorax gibbosus TaxID=931172 RepID=A0AAV6UA96_9ARAC|nr:hypothetical protein JTE90_002646 [Oedothorax gibbosus]